MPGKHLPLTIDIRAAEDEVHAAVKSVCRKLCGTSWANTSNDDIDIITISGGITNCLFRAVDRTTDESVLVRIFGEKTEVLIDRVKDNQTFALLADKGFAPEFLGTFDNGRVEGFMPSRPLAPSEMAATSPVDFVSLIAAETARMHTLPMPGAKDPILWAYLDKWYGMVQGVHFDAGSSDAVEAGKAAKYASLNVPRLGRELAWLKTVLPSEANARGQALLQAAAEAAAAAAGTSVAGSAVAEGACPSAVAPGHVGLLTVPRLLRLRPDTAAHAAAHAAADAAADAAAAAAGKAAALEVATAQARLDATALMYAVVYAHNDLLSGNILHLESPGPGPGTDAGAGADATSGGAGAGAGAGAGVAAEAEADEGGGVVTSPRSRVGSPTYREDRVQIIDYEYGGYNYAGFDVANHFCEHAGFDFDLDKWYPGPRVQHRWFRAYLAKLGITLPTASTYLSPSDSPSDSSSSSSAAAAAVEVEVVEEDAVTAAFLDQLSVIANQFALASHCWWGLWAVVQARHSPIDFDFATYAGDRFKGYDKHKAAFFPSAPLHAPQ